MFVLLRTQPVQRRMPTHAIVENFDVLKDAGTSSVLIWIVILVNQLLLERREETLRNGIVVAVTFSAHAAFNSVTF